MKLFGSSGIRGFANKDISSEFGIKLGAILGSVYDNIVVGYDPRTSSEMLSKAIISGLLSSGANVSICGMVPTPTLARACRKFDCGVIITASHNPPEYNGLKFFNTDGSAFDDKQMNKVETAIEEEKFKLETWDKIGKVYDYKTAVQEHVESILNKIATLEDMTIVVDCGCGAGCTITPVLFRKLGAKVLAINSHPDGFFPARSPEPTEASLFTLKEVVKKTNADLGIAHDGDADRMVAVDENGNFVGGDKLLALFALNEVKKSIVIPVDASMVIDDILSGKKIYRTKVGDAFVSQELKKRKADFGGEPSGAWIFPKESYCPDGVFAAARLAEIVRTSKKLSALISKIPTYPIYRGNVEYKNIGKEELLNRIKASAYGLAASLTTLDGLRFQFEDGWALIRASGTEPKLRISAEARDAKRAKDLYENMLEIVKRCIK